MVSRLWLAGNVRAADNEKRTLRYSVHPLWRVSIEDEDSVEVC